MSDDSEVPTPDLPPSLEEDYEALLRAEDSDLGRSNLSLDLKILKTEVTLTDVRRGAWFLKGLASDAKESAVTVLDETMRYLVRKLGPQYLGEFPQENVLETMAKAKKILAESGEQPSPIEDEHLLPVLEGAARVAGGPLRDSWAHLLASTSRGAVVKARLSRYANLLRDQTPHTVQILNLLYHDLHWHVARDEGRRGEEFFRTGPSLLWNALKEAGSEDGPRTLASRIRSEFPDMTDEDVDLSLQDLTSQGLVGWVPGRLSVEIDDIDDIDGMPKEVSTETPTHVYLTMLGYRFAGACGAQPPSISFEEVDPMRGMREQTSNEV